MKLNDLWQASPVQFHKSTRENQIDDFPRNNGLRFSRVDGSYLPLGLTEGLVISGLSSLFYTRGGFCSMRNRTCIP